MTPMVTYFKWLGISAVAAFSILPTDVKKLLIQWWFCDRKQLMSSAVDTVLKLLTHRSINSCFTMAQDEMKEVVHPDNKVRDR